MTDRIASLGMYDLPGLQAANDALWRLLAGWLRDAGLDRVPDGLDRGRPLAAIWNDAELLLAQTCGYPLMTAWRGRLRYVATPCYAVPGCEGPLYRSRLMVRAGDPAERLTDLRGRIAAVNELSSHSGANALRAAVAPLARGAPFFTTVVETGSHLASARAVADGLADLASIDTITCAHIERHERTLAMRLRPIGWSAPAPGLPLVTAWQTPRATVALLRRGLRWLIDAPEARVAREALLLRDVEVLRVRRYETILGLERRASRAGCPALIDSIG